eukprot:m.150547 g.150547  ORF g.150547 m.150547 type:complete len:1063 (+) comp16880_c0_seq14:201-3389(+)
MFHKRIDCSLKEVLKPTVECVALVRTEKNRDELWCGMGSGVIQVFDAETGKHDTTIQAHKQIITAFLLKPPLLWTASFDRTIKVIDCRNRKVIETLKGHRDAITCLTEAPPDVLYSTGLDGEIIVWNMQSKKRTSDEFVLRSPSSKRPLPIYSFKCIGDRLWAGVANSIVVLNRRTLEMEQRLPSVNIQLQHQQQLQQQQQQNNQGQRQSSVSPFSPAPSATASPAHHTLRRQTSSPSSSSGFGSATSPTPPYVTIAGAGMHATATASPLGRGLPSSHSTSTLSPNFHAMTLSSPSPSFMGESLANTPASSSFVGRPASDRDRLQPRKLPFSVGSSSSDAEHAHNNHQNPPGRSLSVSSTFSTASATSANSGASATSTTSATNAIPTHNSFRPVTATDSSFTWYGGGDASCHSPPKSSHGSSTLITAKTPRSLTKVAAHCVVEGAEGEVWSSSEVAGLVSVWSTKTFELLDEWRIDCQGITVLLLVRGTIWAGAHNGAIFTWDALTHTPLSELRCHSDAIRCLFAVGSSMVLSSSAARDGSVIFWKTLGRGRRASSVSGPPTATGSGSSNFTLNASEVLCYDRYGFLQASASETVPQNPSEACSSLPEEMMSTMQKTNQRIRERQAEWGQYLMLHPEPSLPLSDELRSMIRRGVPDQYRTRFWQLMVQHWIGEDRDVMDKNYYVGLCDFGEQGVATQIELDLLRTFPFNKFFDSPTARGISKLRRVLGAFSKHNAKIGYCQGFNFLAAFSLIFLPEEDTFWFLIALVEKIMPDGYFVHPMLLPRADQRVLLDLIERYLPQTRKKLDEAGIDLSLATFHWFFTAFVECTSTEISLRVWDLLLCDGDEALFRFSLAILKYNEDSLLKMEDRVDLFFYLKSVSKSTMEVDALSTIAANFELDANYIRERRVVHAKAISDEDNDLRPRAKKDTAVLQSSHSGAGSGSGSDRDDNFSPPLLAELEHGLRDGSGLGSGRLGLMGSPLMFGTTPIASAAQSTAQSNVQSPLTAMSLLTVKTPVPGDDDFTHNTLGNSLHHNNNDEEEVFEGRDADGFRHRVGPDEEFMF